MAAPQANEVQPGLLGSAPHGGRGQSHDGQCPTANESAGRLALGIAPEAWAGLRRWKRVTDRRSASGRVERTSEPIMAIRRRGLGFGAGTPRRRGLGDASIRGRLAWTPECSSTGLPRGRQLSGQGVPRSAQQGRPTHNAPEAALARRAWSGHAGRWAVPREARLEETGRALAQPCSRGNSLPLCFFFWLELWVRPSSEGNLRDSFPGPSSEETFQESCPWHLFWREFCSFNPCPLFSGELPG